MRARLICAGAAIAAAVVGAAWLLRYQASYPYNFIDYPGGTYRGSVSVKHHPWWTSYAAVILIVLGAAVATWLLPEARRLVGRLDARRMTALLFAKAQAGVVGAGAAAVSFAARSRK